MSSRKRKVSTTAEMPEGEKKAKSESKEAAASPWSVCTLDDLVMAVRCADDKEGEEEPLWTRVDALESSTVVVDEKTHSVEFLPNLPLRAGRLYSLALLSIRQQEPATDFKEFKDDVLCRWPDLFTVSTSLGRPGEPFYEWPTEITPRLAYSFIGHLDGTATLEWCRVTMPPSSAFKLAPRKPAPYTDYQSFFLQVQPARVYDFSLLTYWGRDARLLARAWEGKNECLFCDNRFFNAGEDQLVAHLRAVHRCTHSAGCPEIGCAAAIAAHAKECKHAAAVV